MTKFKGSLLRLSATVLTVLLLASTMVSAQAVKPSPASDFGSIIKRDYEKVQADPLRSEEEKTKNAIASLLALEYESQREYKAFDLSFLFGSSPQARDTLRYEAARLQMFVISAKHYGSGIKWYSLRPKFETLQVTGDTAAVIARPVADLRSYTTPERLETMGEEPHTIRLTKEQGQWKIAEDMYTDEFTRLYPRDTDFTPILADFEGRLKAFDAQDKINTERLRSDPHYGVKFQSTPPAGSVAPLATYRGYDRAAAATYALTYTDNTGGCGTSSYNPKFQEYASRDRCNDCQNFVSQAVWAGFGGVNDAQSIEAHALPMVDENSAATHWWADSKTTDSNWMWVNVDVFKNTIVDNYNNSKGGVQGMVGTLGGMMKGDYVWIPGHVVLITDWVDANGNGTVEYGELYFSAHTYNYKNERLSTRFPDPSAVTYMWIMIYKEP